MWRRSLIDEADVYLKRAWALGPPGPRTIQAAIHGTWCWRRSLDEPPPWDAVLSLYDALLTQRDDVVVRLNRAVAVAEVMGIEAAVADVDALGSQEMNHFLPYHAVRADLLQRAGRIPEAHDAYDAALALGPGLAERTWLERRKRMLFEH